jgi:hypothetical protein
MFYKITRVKQRLTLLKRYLYDFFLIKRYLNGNFINVFVTCLSFNILTSVNFTR